MSRGQERASKRNSAPRGSRDRDCGAGQIDCSGPVRPSNTCKQLNSSELEGDWRLS